MALDEICGRADEKTRRRVDDRPLLDCRNDRSSDDGSVYRQQTRRIFGLVKTAALELAESKIRVNAIGPGPIDNRMIRSLESQFSPEDAAAGHDFIMSKIPMGRYGTNDEVANLALFLASDESSYCTGGIHMIDGGWIAA